MLSDSTSCDEYIVIATLHEERTAHVYGPYSYERAAAVERTLSHELSDAEVSVVPRVKMVMDDGAT